MSLLLLLFSAVNLLTAINRIQIKSFCSQNIYVYCVYLLCIYKYKHMHVYIYETYFVFILNIFIYNIIYMNTCKYFQNTVYCVCVCIYIYIINIHSAHMYSVNKNFYFECN